MACVCIKSDLCDICDFDGLGSCSKFPSLTEALSTDDRSFIDECVIPASHKRESEIVKRRRVSNNNYGQSAVVNVEPFAAIADAAAAEAASVKNRHETWKGPLSEINRVCGSISGPAASKVWVEESRVRAIIGSC